MGSRLALIIGNNDFEDAKLSRLASPLNDSLDFAKVLKEKTIGGFDEVVLAENEAVHRLNLIISSFFGKKKKDDLLVFYYSGHGILDSKGRLYLAAKDSDHEMLRATAINTLSLVDEINESYSKKKVIILDCCHSGAFASGTKSILKERVGTESIFQGDGYGRVVLTASDSIEYALDGNIIKGLERNSVFTHFLVEGLRTGKADLNSDGQITLDELYEYVYEKVRQSTHLQTPQKWTYKQEGRLLIARNPSFPVNIFELPSDLSEALKSPFIDLRIGAANVLGSMLKDASKHDIAHKYLSYLATDQNKEVAKLAAGLLGMSLVSTLRNRNNETYSTIQDILCPRCQSTRSKDFRVPCPICGARKYNLIGYTYPLEANSIRRIIYLFVFVIIFIVINFLLLTRLNTSLFETLRKIF